MNYAVLLETANDGTETPGDLALLLSRAAREVAQLGSIRGVGHFCPPSEVDLKDSNGAYLGRITVIPLGIENATGLAEARDRAFESAVDEFAEAKLSR